MESEEASQSWTVPCINDGCGHMVSRNANACPHCGTLQTPDRSHRPCRACGTALPKAQFRYLVRHGLFLSENHNPCPNCGEPQPLWTPVDSFLQGTKVLFIAVVFVLAIGILMIVSKNIRDYRRLYEGYESHPHHHRAGCSH